MENVPETSTAFTSTAMRGNYLATIKIGLKGVCSTRLYFISSLKSTYNVSEGFLHQKVIFFFMTIFHPLSDPYVKRAVFATVPLRLLDVNDPVITKQHPCTIIFYTVVAS